MKTISIDQLEQQVFLAVDDEAAYLPFGEEVILETLSADDDGIFPTEHDWRTFILDNFAVHDGSDGVFWLNGDCDQKTIEKVCYAEAEYKHKFARQVALDTCVVVPAEDIELSFTYSTNFFTDKRRDLPAHVEIYVTAKFKGAQK